MKISLTTTIVFFVLAPLNAADADELKIIPADPSLLELPELLFFDCSTVAGEAVRYVRPFDRPMRVPKHFVVSESDSNWLNWNAFIVDSTGSRVSFPFASISFGDIGSKDELVVFNDWPIDSTASSNLIGAEVRVKPVDSADSPARYEVLLTADLKFLKAMSLAPIDWVSLVSCFE